MNKMLSGYVNQKTIDELESLKRGFEEAESNNAVTEELAAKYLMTLERYINAFEPWLPTSVNISPTDSDIIVKQMVNDEVAIISAEMDRCKKYLPMLAKEESRNGSA